MAYPMFICYPILAFVLILSINASTNFMRATGLNGSIFQDGLGVASPGQSISIECPHKGNISWSRKSVVTSVSEAIGSSNERIKLRDKYLDITNIELSDGKVYFCEQNGVVYRFFLYVYAITNTTNGTAPTSTYHYELNGIQFTQTKLNEKGSANISCTCDSGQSTTEVNINWSGGLYTNKVSDTYSNEVQKRGSAVTNTLILHKPQNVKDMYGPYTCTCNAVSGALKEIEVYMKAPPIFENHESSMRATDGQNVTITCRVWGYPAITSGIEWRFQNQTKLREGISVVEFPNDSGRSDLVINQVTQDDRGVYSCHAENEVGSNTAATMLRVKGRYAALWPFIGIVIQLVILAIIIIVYEWKKSHKPHDDSSNFNYDSTNKQDSAIAMKSSEVTDVRQRLMKE